MKTFLYQALKATRLTTQRRLRLAIRLGVLIIGLIAAFVMSVKIQLLDFSGGAKWLLLVGAAAAVEFVFADVIAERSFPYDTERKLALMEERLGRSAIETISRRLRQAILELRGCDPTLVSATVHVITELGATADQRVREGLLQLTEYVGFEGGRKGRITLITQGIIGRCARTRELETVDFADADDYRESMVRDFGFSPDETERHSKRGRSYLAFPLTHSGKVVGVLYFFSREPQVFPRAVDQRRLEDLAREIVGYLALASLV
jgi:GAF domain